MTVRLLGHLKRIPLLVLLLDYVYFSPFLFFFFFLIWASVSGGMFERGKILYSTLGLVPLFSSSWAFVYNLLLCLFFAYTGICLMIETRCEWIGYTIARTHHIII